MKNRFSHRKNIFFGLHFLRLRLYIVFRGSCGFLCPTPIRLCFPLVFKNVLPFHTYPLILSDSPLIGPLRASDRKSSKFMNFSICQCHVLVRNFFKNKYFLIPPVFFESYDCVESFRALTCSKTPPDEKVALYFVRAIFEIFSFSTFGRFSKISKFSTFGATPY